MVLHTQMRLSNVPTELVTRIAEFLPFSDQRSCCYVSKRFSLAARKPLYSFIDINSLAFFNRFYQSLSECPANGVLVRHLKCSYDFDLHSAEANYETVSLTTQKVEATLALLSNIRTFELLYLNLAFVNRFLHGTFPFLRQINWNIRVDEFAGTFFNRHPQIRSISAGYVFFKLDEYGIYDLEGKDKVVTPIRLPNLTHFHGSPREFRFVSEFTTKLTTAVIYDSDVAHPTNWTDNEEETIEILYQKSQGQLRAFGFRGLTWKSPSLEAFGARFQLLTCLLIINELPTPNVDEGNIVDDSLDRIKEFLVALKFLLNLERVAYMDLNSAFYGWDERRRALLLYDNLYNENDERYKTVQDLIIDVGRTCRCLKSCSLPRGFGRWFRSDIKQLDTWVCQSADSAWSTPKPAITRHYSVLRRFKREVAAFSGVEADFSFIFGTFE